MAGSVDLLGRRRTWFDIRDVRKWHCRPAPTLDGQPNVARPLNGHFLTGGDLRSLHVLKIGDGSCDLDPSRDEPAMRLKIRPT